jgi:hypothetical protein
VSYRITNRKRDVNGAGTAFLVFIFIAASALAGLGLRRKLPEHHIDDNAKTVVNLVMGLIATMSALVLGLLIVSAKSNFDTQSGYVAQLAAQTIEIDRILAHYGPETAETRALFRETVILGVQRIWPNDRMTGTLEPPKQRGQLDAFYDHLERLDPKTSGQRIAQSNAMQLSTELLSIRTLMYEKLRNSLALPFLVVLVFWLMLLFVGFGLQTQTNPTILTVLLLGALSAAGAIFLILELDQPYDGLIRVSSEPLQRAIAALDQPL